MTKDVGILVLGLVVAAMPFLGFPGSIEQIIFVVSGLIIAILAFIIHGELDTTDHETESYSQKNSSSSKRADGMKEKEGGGRTEHDQESSREE